MAWTGDFIRSGEIARVGALSFVVYQVLRDFIWRSDKTGRPELREAWSSGLLVASIRIERVSELTGLGRTTIKRSILKLEEEGLVETRRSPGQISLYVLGEVREGKEIYTGWVRRGPTQEGEVGPERTGGWVRRGPTPGPERTGGGSGEDRSSRTVNVEPTKENLKPRTDNLDRDRPTRKVRRSIPPPPTKLTEGSKEEGAKEKAPPRRVPDPGVEGRTIPPDELRHLQSARAKAANGRKGDYSGPEAVAVWRLMFLRAFGNEDPDLETKAARTRSARQFTTRATSWTGGDRARLMAYLKAQVAVWRDKSDKDSFPPGEAPRLRMLLKQDKDGPSWFWRDWSIGKSKRRKKRGGG